jgi:putative membrane protein
MVLDRKALKYYRMLRIPVGLSKISKYLYVCSYMIIISPYLYKYFLSGMRNYREVYVLIIHSFFIAFLPLFIKMLVDYMKIRQCINMSLFLLVPGIPIEIVGIFLGIEGLAYVIVPIIGVIAIRSFTYSRSKSMMIIFYTLIAELIFTLVFDITLTHFISRFTLLSISIAVSLIFTESLAYREGFDIYRVTSSWIKTLLLNDEEEFSAIMNEIGFDTETLTHVMMFEFNSRYVALVVPEIHYGPFRNIGSASLPQILDNILEPHNIAVVALHGAGSHERNLVSFNESLRYGYSVADMLITKKRFREDMLNEPFRVYTDFFEAFVIQTNTASYIFISTPTRGNDDIPYEIQKKAIELGKLYGFEDVVIIDAHNVEGMSITDPKVYEGVLLASLSKSSRQCEDLYVGFGEACVKGIVRGLCNNKVKAITIKCNNKLYGLIYLYGNNAERGVREELRKIALKYGYSDVEVITADDHSCSGINFDAPYHTIELNSSLIRAVEVALKNSLSNFEKGRVYIAKLHIQTKIVGHKIFRLLEVAKILSRKILKYLVFSHLLIYIMVLILVLI